ncbi:INAR1 protein, partial [Sakesphorus luctuosus]|nr:INAR1 protein [Sakesphorus luctuosus]
EDSLQSPQDLQVLVVNTNFTLSWSHPGPQRGVTFWAQYRGPDTVGAEWQDLPGCCNVSGTACDFSSAITEYYDVHSLRVQAQHAGHSSPWSRELHMVPEHEAQIGPPGIELQPTNGDIKIKISPPEANQPQKMWIDDTTFKYNLIFWENSSDPQPRRLSVFPVDTIEGLSPNTTYCFRVWATLPVEGKEGQLSPPCCASTTHRGRISCFTRLGVSAAPSPRQNLLGSTGRAAAHPGLGEPLPRLCPLCCSGYLKMYHEDHSGKWQSVPGCQHIPGTNCSISSIITTFGGSLYLRVQAQGGHNSSCLSREVRLDPLITNEIGPPGVKLDISDAVLHIQISPPGDELMRNSYGLSYRILYWKNSSNAEEEPQVKETKQTVATIADLAPDTWYCVRVQALSQHYNKSSALSQEQCTLSPAEQTLPLVLLVTFTVALLAVLVVVLPLGFVLYQAYSKLRYVFFPSCQTPLNIEGFGGHLCSSPYLAAPEEPIEDCSIIESMITYEGNQIHLNDWKHSKESSRDSGNYSNDDNTSGSKGSAETLEKEMV